MKIGTLVKKKNFAMPKGTLVANLAHSPGLVAVEWENGLLEKVRVDDLQELPTLDEAYKLIQDKVAAASALLKEANDLADMHNTSLANLYYDLGLSSLLQEIESAGWSSSSMKC